MKGLPSHLLKMRVVHELPRHQYMAGTPEPEKLVEKEARHSFLKFLRQGKPSNKNKATRPANQHMHFNAAMWLEFSKPPEQPVSLWLVCEDDKGCHAELVDEQNAGDSLSLMLSGNVSVRAYGDIKTLKFACAGLKDHENFRLAEQHVKLSESEIKRKAS